MMFRCNSLFDICVITDHCYGSIFIYGELVVHISVVARVGGPGYFVT